MIYLSASTEFAENRWGGRVLGFRLRRAIAADKRGDHSCLDLLSLLRPVLPWSRRNRRQSPRSFATCALEKRSYATSTSDTRRLIPSATTSGRLTRMQNRLPGSKTAWEASGELKFSARGRTSTWCLRGTSFVSRSKN